MPQQDNHRHGKLEGHVTRLKTTRLKTSRLKTSRLEFNP